MRRNRREKSTAQTKQTSCTQIFWQIVKLPLAYPKSMIIASVALMGSLLMPRHRETPQCEGFELISSVPGNRSAFQGEWTFLGEWHSRKQETWACVEKLTQDLGPHDILTESPYREGGLNCAREFGIPEKKGRSCNGWQADIRQEQSDVLDEAYTIFFETFYNSFQQQKVSDKKYDHFLQDQLKKNRAKISLLALHLSAPVKAYETSEITAYTQVERNVQVILVKNRVIEDLRAMHKEGHTYAELFQEKSQQLKKIKLYHKVNNNFEPNFHRIIDPDDRAMTEEVIKHSEGMIHTLFSRQKGKSTIVIAGKYHLVDPGGTVGEGARKLQTKLTQSGEPHTILAMK